MKKICYALALAAMTYGCKSTQNITPPDQTVVSTLDLVNVQDDKIMVSVDPGRFSKDTTTFFIPKIVPGTYSTSNYGKYAESLKAYDYKGREMTVIQVDDNSWRIPDAEKLDKVTYWTNDTFDIPGEGGIYSMAGTNIAKDQNYLLNLHGFVGYFEGMKENKYRLEIKRPANMYGGTALRLAETKEGEQDDAKTDIFNMSRYFEVIDNPIMYTTPDTASFKVEDMNVLLHVYSPNQKFSAQDLKPSMERMISAQKNFLGEVDQTQKYAILLYLSDTPGEGDASNFGALEHHTSTVVVLPEMISKEELEKNMIDIVSHEFFHIVTPLGIHSNEIHYFDYNEPEMSKHLWLYEGVTEYFANLFQVNQGLISDEDFYERIYDKIATARNFDDTMPFTVMSENILEDSYKDSYYNVYMKGALIGMALDIRLRELSNGQTGILDLMKRLTAKYGKDRPFEDDKLISEITEMTYPEIQEFFDKYVSGPTPIPYDKFFEKVGLEMVEAQVPVGYFLKDEATPYITLNQAGNIFIRNDVDLNSFHKKLGLENGDMIKSINGTAYSRDNIYDLITTSMAWEEGENVVMVVQRDGEEVTLESTIEQPTAPGMKLVEKPGASDQQIELRYAWLKG